MKPAANPENPVEAEYQPEADPFDKVEEIAASFKVGSQIRILMTRAMTITMPNKSRSSPR